MPSMQPSFHGKPLLGLRPDAYGTGTHDATIDTRGYKWMRIASLVGDIASGGTLTVSVLEGDASDGSDAVAITGAAFTALTPAGDRVVNHGELYLAPRKRYVTVRAVLAGAGGDIAVPVDLCAAREEPATSDVAFSVLV